MGVTATGRNMARPRGRPKKPTGVGTQVRIDADLVSKARYLATAKGIHISELLSDILRPVIERDFKQAAKDIEG